MVTRARRYISFARRRVFGIRASSANPYATHLPVLTALAHILEPGEVLELGSGLHSTGLFLDQDVFSSLKKLTSLEDDPEWAKAVAESIGHDQRLDLRTQNLAPLNVPDIDRYDLIFIDDSRTVSERTRTIESVVRLAPRGVIAIHDFEERKYRAAARPFDHRFIFRSFTPQVGVLWFGDILDRGRLLTARNAIEATSDVLDPDDIREWNDRLGRALA